MSENLETHLLVDEAASPEQLELIRANLSNDPRAQQEYEVFKALKTKLLTLQNDSSFSKSESDQIFKQAMGKIGRKPEGQKAEKFVTKYSFAMAGALLLFIVGSGIISRNSGGRSLSPSDLTQVSSQSTANVAGNMTWGELGNWFNQKLGRSPIDVAPQNWTVRNVLEMQSPQGSFIRVDFSDSRGDFWLVIAPDTKHIEGMKDCPTGDFKESMSNGTRSVCWTARGYGFAVMGKRDSADLQAIAKVLKR